MVATSARLRGWVLPGCLFAVCFCWAGLSLGCLPALAAEYTPPTSPFNDRPFPVPEPTAAGGWKTNHQCEAEYHGETKAGGGESGVQAWLTAENTFESCRLLGAGLPELAKRLFWITDEVILEREKVETAVSKIEQLHTDLGNVESKEAATSAALGTGGSLYARLGEVLAALGTTGQLHKDLTAAGGLPVAGSVTVSNPTSVAGLEASVASGTETSNQNVWAIFGMVVGFGLLAFLYKLVRP